MRKIKKSLVPEISIDDTVGDLRGYDYARGLIYFNRINFREVKNSRNFLYLVSRIGNSKKFAWIYFREWAKNPGENGYFLQQMGIFDWFLRQQCDFKNFARI